MIIDKLISITKLLERDLEDRYSTYGLTINQAELLLYFYQFENNEINATNALKELGMDKRLMSIALKALETKGYITRQPNEFDKRQKDIELSLSSLEICEDLIAIKEEVNALFESNLSNEQIKVISSIEMENYED